MTFIILVFRLNEKKKENREIAEKYLSIYSNNLTSKKYVVYEKYIIKGFNFFKFDFINICFNIQIFQVKVFTMTTKINVRIHHKHSTINLDINNNDTIDQVKQKICDEINENGTNENGTNDNGTNENGTNDNGTNDNDGIIDINDFIHTDFTENTDNLKINRLRLYPMVNNDIKTGYSFYGISGKDKLQDNHFKTNNYVVFLTL